MRSFLLIAFAFLPAFSFAQNAYKQDWEAITENRHDTVISTLVDLGLNDVAPLKDARYHFSLTLPLESAQNGLLTSAEQPTLERVQFRLNQILTEGGQGVLAAMVTGGGRRTLHYYLAQPMPDTALISTAFILYPQYKGYQMASAMDTGWVYYKTHLFPNPREYRKLQNNKVIEQLVLNGDQLGTVRPVDHFIHFKTQKEAERFAKKVKKDKFTVVSLTTDSAAPDSVRPVLLRLSRIDTVNPVDVDNYVLPLWEAALKADATYEGWQTVVRR